MSLGAFVLCYIGYAIQQSAWNQDNMSLHDNELFSSSKPDSCIPVIFQSFSMILACTFQKILASHTVLGWLEYGCCDHLLPVLKLAGLTESNVGEVKNQLGPSIIILWLPDISLQNWYQFYFFLSNTFYSFNALAGCCETLSAALVYSCCCLISQGLGSFLFINAAPWIITSLLLCDHLWSYYNFL